MSSNMYFMVKRSALPIKFRAEINRYGLTEMQDFGGVNARYLELHVNADGIHSMKKSDPFQLFRHFNNCFDFDWHSKGKDICAQR
jgi:hypothetical protein